MNSKLLTLTSLVVSLFGLQANAQTFAGEYERTFIRPPANSYKDYLPIPRFCSVTKIQEINPTAVGGALGLTFVNGPNTVTGEVSVRDAIIKTNVVAQPQPVTGCGSYCGDADYTTELPTIYRVTDTQIAFFDGRGLRNSKLTTNKNPSYTVEKNGNELTVTANYLQFPTGTDEEVLVGSGVVCVLTKK